MTHRARWAGLLRMVGRDTNPDRRPRQTCRPVAVGLVCAVAIPALGACGCGGSKRWHKHPFFVTEADAAAYMIEALEAAHPDDRREAVVRLARTRYAQRDVVLRGFATIARTDPNKWVRWAAIGALGQAQDPKYARDLIAILETTEDEATVRAADAELRWATVDALTAMVKGGSVSAEERSVMGRMAAHDLRRGRSRDLRLACARLLGFVPERASLDALVEALDDREFGVVYEAERSLMRLTGQRFEHDAFAWRDWLAATDDPFADAGRLDAVLDAEPPDAWQRFRSTWRRRFGPRGVAGVE